MRKDKIRKIGGLEGLTYFDVEISKRDLAEDDSFAKEYSQKAIGKEQDRYVSMEDVLAPEEILEYRQTIQSIFRRLNHKDEILLWFNHGEIFREDPQAGEWELPQSYYKIEAFSARQHFRMNGSIIIFSIKNAELEYYSTLLGRFDRCKIALLKTTNLNEVFNRLPLSAPVPFDGINYFDSVENATEFPNVFPLFQWYCEEIRNGTKLRFWVRVPDEQQLRAVIEAEFKPAGKKETKASKRSKK